MMGVPLAVEGLVVGFCSTVVFLVHDWMTAPDVERGWLISLVVPLEAMRGCLGQLPGGLASWKVVD